VRDTRLTCYTQAPEVQTMYSLNLPVSTLRTKIRQEFERHRYVNQMRTVDVLLFNSHQEYQVRCQIHIYPHARGALALGARSGVDPLHITPSEAHAEGRALNTSRKPSTIGNS
jgi:hypothetical protein